MAGRAARGRPCAGRREVRRGAAGGEVRGCGGAPRGCGGLQGAAAPARPQPPSGQLRGKAGLGSGGRGAAARGPVGGGRTAAPRHLPGIAWGGGGGGGGGRLGSGLQAASRWKQPRVDGVCSPSAISHGGKMELFCRRNLFLINRPLGREE